MTKKFNIHDWQAKQIQKYLNEQDDDRPDNWRELPGYNPDYFYKDFDKVKAAAGDKKVPVLILGDKKEVTIKTTPGKDLSDVTISWIEPWGKEEHTVDFEFEDVHDDHGNEGMDATFTAEAEGGKGWNWIFMLDVYLEASYYQSGNIGDWDWDTLEIDKEETDEEQEEYDKHWYKEQKTVGGEMEKWLDTEPFEKDDEDLRLEPEDDGWDDEVYDDDLDPEGGVVDEFELKDLTFDQIVNAFPDNYTDVHFTRKQPNGEEGNYYRDGINFPNFDDSSTHIGDENAWEDWKDKTMRHYGNVEIVLNSEGKNWFDKVFISDDQFNDDRDQFIKGKMSAMQRDQELGRSID